MILEIVYGVLLILALVLFSGIAVDIFEKMAREVKVNKLLLATFLVSFSTSLPELSVGLASAIKGQPQIALGNLLGASIANLSWIVGGAAVVSGTIPVIGDYLKKDLWMAIGMSMMPFLLMADGRLSRIDGLLLIIIYIFYTKTMLRGSEVVKHSKLRKHKIKIVKVSWLSRVIRVTTLIGSLAAMGAASHYLIVVALKVSSVFGVNSYWVGLLVISLGTTLPELILSIFASKKRDISLLLGNILGSVVVNSTFILGLVAVIAPIVFEESVQKGLTGIFFIIILAMFWTFTKTKRKLERWEGLSLIGIYLMFVGLQFILA